MNKLKAITSSVCTLTLVGGLLAACGGEQATGGGKAEGGKSEGSKQSGPVKASMMMIFYTPEPPKNDSPVLKQVQEHINMNLDITWVPSSAYDDKVNAAIAASELPQIVVANPRNTAVMNAADSGMFWEISPYIKDLPNVKTLNEMAFKNSSINGKIYGLPRSRPLTRDGVTYRKDWLEKLGLPEPKTVEDLVNVFRAFTTKDPDGNGKNDTYGFSSAGPGPAGFTSFMAWYGGPNGWGEKDGKLLPDFMFPQYMEVLKLYKTMYNEKLFNQDFAAVKDSTKLINEGKAGVYLGVIDDVIARFTDLYKSNPKAYLDVIGKIQGPGGVKIGAGTGYNNAFFFPKTSIKTEAELKKILTAIDKLGDKEIQNLYEWGIDGVHSKIENGKRKLIDGKKYNDEVRTPFFQMRFDDGSLAEKGENLPVHEKFIRLQKENEDPKIAVHNPTHPLVSKTRMEKGSELDKIINDARVKFIMGELDEAGFKKAVEQWQKQGGDKIIEEYNADYAKLKKK